MGCASSKLDDLPAVCLCRDRCQFLEEAIQQRYALAEAHVAYIQALKGVGLCLYDSFDQDLGTSIPSLSPVLPLPTRKKGDPLITTTDTSASPLHAAVAYHSHSNSGSHLHFHSDSEDGSLHYSGHSSPMHSNGQFHHDYHDPETLSSIPGGFMTMNYMKNRATPSVTYAQRPMSPEETTVHMGESSYYSYPNPNPNPSSYQQFGYPNYGGFFPYGSSSPPPPPPAAAAPTSASSSKPAPPPPSPPRNSSWDFLNPFDAFERFYPSNTPSRDSKEVRREEGIPDLEDEEYQYEVVKEVHGDEKFVDGVGNYSKMAADEVERGNGGEALYRTRPRPSVAVENEKREYDVHLVDKNVVANEERGNVAAFQARGSPHPRGVYEVMREIQLQFERASESGIEVSKMLEAGKLPYHRKNAVYQVSSKMLHVITPLSVVSSQPSASTSAESSSSAEKSGSIYLDFDEDVGMRSGNLSSTLQKLSMWEKKLYDEVKAEEKMRIIHERKCRRLKRLNERGSEADKIDSTRTLIRTLSTKIRIAIQVVDKISIKINKLRDEELWPQINELIQGLVRMWKVMLECHRNQFQAIAEAKSLDVIAFNKKFDDAHLEALVQLGQELMNWISSFSSWIGSQKGFVRALNSWLLKCIFYEPEETPDGIAPFSPGRIGAPPVFVICNHWSQAMERISEKEVVDAMRVFSVSVFQLWQQKVGMRQRMITNRDLESKSKTLERGEQKIQKAMQALDKKMVLVYGEGSWFPIHGQIVNQSETINISILQSGLKQIFETMERFTTNSMQVYEELWARSEEDRLARENAKVP
ncbi:hypothetical protein HHK36_008782 [Tetracentron sinense]|uniref:Uncharacterized protein n=1 Tax=Tetracentron sinense TaxID=13715 RepID=A0A834ZGY6_TETSI|nr:hypothetical protein HHK36_008782 [Tetracentron sinense]